ncbi:MAG: hypothetical protein IIU87_04155 [Prevotella sp.]|nr:hypothetical protein [Prevotella sp.]
MQHVDIVPEVDIEEQKIGKKPATVAMVMDIRKQPVPHVMVKDVTLVEFAKDMQISKKIVVDAVDMELFILTNNNNITNLFDSLSL